QRVTALYQRLVRRSPSPALASSFVRFLLAEGSVDAAASELVRARALFEDSRDLQILSGEVARLRGNADAALQAFRSALDPSPPARRDYGCRACTRTVGHGAARCPGCGAWDSLAAAV